MVRVPQEVYFGVEDTVAIYIYTHTYIRKIKGLACQLVGLASLYSPCLQGYHLLTILEREE